MSQKTVLLAGASGVVGREILRQSKERGEWKVRTFSRDRRRAEALSQWADEVRVGDARDPKSLQGLCDGVDVVMSCLGGSVSLDWGHRASYFQMDTQTNQNLLAEAQRAGCGRFVYVAAHVGEGYAHTRYIQAHERMVESLEQSGISHTVLRPTGIFSAFAAMLPMARRGFLPLIGDGSATSNPIHPMDVADACVANLWEGPKDRPLGGPDVFTRRQMAEIVFEVLGKKPRLMRVPPWVFRFNSLLLRWVHPRLSELFEFVTAVSCTDCVAPTVGTRTLKEYLQEASH